MVGANTLVCVEHGKPLSISHFHVREAVGLMRTARVSCGETTPIQAVLRAALREHIRLVRRFSFGFPRDWIRRFELSSSEEEVLWLFIARELCPVVRDGLQLISEGMLSPTSDDVRSVVYDPINAARAVRELGAQGALRRYWLLEREIFEDVPVPRLTLTLGRRVPIELRSQTHRELTGCLRRYSRTGDPIQGGSVWMAEHWRDAFALADTAETVGQEQPR